MWDWPWTCSSASLRADVLQSVVFHFIFPLWSLNREVSKAFLGFSFKMSYPIPQIIGAIIEIVHVTYLAINKCVFPSFSVYSEKKMPFSL